MWTRALSALLLPCVMGASGPSAHADECPPGDQGCLPTAERCAEGDHNGAWLGRHVGAGAVCVAADGHSILYVGGNANPFLLCGSVVVGDQPFAQSDVNECDSVGPAPGALRFRVQLPSDYGTSQRSYPVLYLLPGGEGDEDRWFEIDPTIPALADQGVIIVSVYNVLGFYNDWRSGEHAFETLYTGALVSLVDSQFRTFADRAYRAVAGVSQGGYGAMFFAARHPDLYVAAASFSGAVDVANPIAEAYLTAGYGTGFATYANPIPSMPVWGNPLTEEVWWRGRNPTDLAINLRGVVLWAASGDGVPTIDKLAHDPSVLTWGSSVELLVRQMNDTFDAELTRIGIAHTYVRRAGIHDPSYAVADLHEWFPIMMDSFGTPPSSTFDYRSVERSFSVWDWTFETDPQRAPEFLEANGVSPSGLTITGSGITTVRTPPLFVPCSTVGLSGATTASATADGTGRIEFRADLGAPHAAQQYTPEQRLAEAAAGAAYFATRKVSFAPMGGTC